MNLGDRIGGVLIIGCILVGVLTILFGAYYMPHNTYENEQDVIAYLGFPIDSSEEIPVGQTVRIEEFSDFIMFLKSENPTKVYYTPFKAAVPFWRAQTVHFYFFSTEGVIYQYPQWG